MDALSRFMKFVSVTESCWLWTGTKSDGGYGRFWFGGGVQMAHRWHYERVVGPIPSGLEMDHLCRVKACVNPAHLEAVTHKENVARMPDDFRGAYQRLRTHCPQGHPYQGWNLIRDPQGRRHCRNCGYARSRARDLRIGRTAH